MTTLTHGMKNHPHYCRWNSMIQRCYNPDNRSYAFYGKRGIRVEDIWGRDNPDGVRNFLFWIDCESEKFYRQHPEYKGQRFVVMRKDVNKNFSPSNCEIKPRIGAVQSKRKRALEFDDVVKMRRYKRANPDVSLEAISKLFNCCLQTVSTALRGVTWASVNSVEPPFDRFNTPASEKGIGRQSNTVQTKEVEELLATV